MKKGIWVLCLLLVCVASIFAQDKPKVELFGGYSWAGGNFHGWNGSVTGNVNKWFGLMGDLSGHYGSELDGSVRINQDAHTLMLGPRFSHRGKKLTPFAYVLVGATRFHESATIGGQRVSISDTGSSLALGGGLDVRINDRVAIRTFQLDYFLPHFFGEVHQRGRLAFGVVLRLGNR